MRHLQRILILLTAVGLLTAIAAHAENCDPKIVGEYYNPKLDGEFGTTAFVKIQQFKKNTTAEINIPCGTKVTAVTYNIKCSNGIAFITNSIAETNNQQCSIGESAVIEFKRDIFQQAYHLDLRTKIRTPGFNGTYSFEKYVGNDPKDEPVCPDDICQQW